MKKRHVTIPIFIPHLGCPHRCSFCNQWESSGAEKVPDSDYIKNRINRYLENIDTESTETEIAFFGGSFTGIKKELQEEFLIIAEKYLREGTVSGIRVSTRPDYINPESIKLLKKYNVRTVELGVQSFSNTVLVKTRRGHSAEDSVNAAKLLKKEGMNMVLQLMPGLPGDCRKTSIESAYRAAELTPNAVRIYPAVVLANTELEKIYREGSYSPLTLESAVETCSKMLKIFNHYGIPVIRTGLHPFSPEESESLISGPYHPAFGFLVKSRLKRDKIEECLTSILGDNPGSGKWILELPALCSEEYIGYRKENISYLKNKYKLDVLEYRIGKKQEGFLFIPPSHRTGG
jgi:radical SAM enzyme (TIGR01210 family)